VERTQKQEQTYSRNTLSKEKEKGQKRTHEAGGEVGWDELESHRAGKKNPRETGSKKCQRGVRRVPEK